MPRSSPGGGGPAKSPPKKLPASVFAGKQTSGSGRTAPKPKPKPAPAKRPLVLAPGAGYDPKRNAATTPGKRPKKTGTTKRTFSFQLPKLNVSGAGISDLNRSPAGRTRIKQSRKTLNTEIKRQLAAEAVAPLAEGLVARDLRKAQKGTAALRRSFSAPPKSTGNPLVAKSTELRGIMERRGGIMQKELRKAESDIYKQLRKQPIGLNRQTAGKRNVMAPLIAAQRLDRKASKALSRKPKRGTMAQTSKDVKSRRTWVSIKKDLGTFQGEGYGERRLRGDYEKAVKRAVDKRKPGWVTQAVIDVSNKLSGGAAKGVGKGLDELNRNKALRQFLGGTGPLGAGAVQALTTSGGTAGAALNKKTGGQYGKIQQKNLQGLLNYPIQAVPSMYFLGKTVVEGNEKQLWESFKKNDPLGALVTGNSKRAGQLILEDPSYISTLMLPYVGAGRVLGGGLRAAGRVTGAKAFNRAGRTGGRAAQRTVIGDMEGVNIPDAARFTRDRRYSKNAFSKIAQIASDRVRAKAADKLRERKTKIEDKAIGVDKANNRTKVDSTLRRLDTAIRVVDPEIVSPGISKWIMQNQTAKRVGVHEAVRRVHGAQVDDALSKTAKEVLGVGLWNRIRGKRSDNELIDLVGDIIQILPNDLDAARTVLTKRRDMLVAARDYEPGKPATKAQRALQDRIDTYDSLLDLPRSKFDAAMVKASDIQIELRQMQAKNEGERIKQGSMDADQVASRFLPSAITQFEERFKYEPGRAPTERAARAGRMAQRVEEAAGLAENRVRDTRQENADLASKITDLRKDARTARRRDDQDRAMSKAYDRLLELEQQRDALPMKSPEREVMNRRTTALRRQIMRAEGAPNARVSAPLIEMGRKAAEARQSQPQRRIAEAEQQIQTNKQAIAAARGRISALKKSLEPLRKAAGDKWTYDFKLDGRPIRLSEIERILSNQDTADIFGVNPVNWAVWLSHSEKGGDNPADYYMGTLRDPTERFSRTGTNYREGLSGFDWGDVRGAMRRGQTRADVTRSLKALMSGMAFGVATTFKSAKEADKFLKELQAATGGMEFVVTSARALERVEGTISSIAARMEAGLATGDVNLIKKVRGDLDDAVLPEVPAGTTDVLVIPKTVWDEFTALQGGAFPGNKFTDAVTGLNQQFKKTVLPLSPTFYIGNIVENNLRILLDGGINIRTWLDAAAIHREIMASPNPAETAARMLPGQLMRSPETAGVSSRAERTVLSGDWGGALGDITGAMLRTWDRISLGLRAFNEIFAETGGAYLGGKPRNIPSWMAGIPWVGSGPVALAAARTYRRELQAVYDGMENFQYLSARALAEQAVGNARLSDEFAGKAIQSIQQTLGAYDMMTARSKAISRYFLPFFDWARNAIVFTAFTFPVKHPFMFSLLMNIEAVMQDQLQDAANTVAGENPDELPEFLRSAILLPNGKRLEVARYTPFAIGSDPAGAVLSSAGGPIQGVLANLLLGVDWTGRQLKTADGGQANAGDRAVAGINNLLQSLVVGYRQAGLVARQGAKPQDSGLTGFFKAKEGTQPTEKLDKLLIMLSMPHAYDPDPTGKRKSIFEKNQQQFDLMLKGSSPKVDPFTADQAAFDKWLEGLTK